jgi:membrane-bound lytic murein transglycosylase B
MNDAAFRTIFLTLALALSGQETARADIAERPDVRSFIKDVSVRRGIDADELKKLFKQVEIQQKILDAMARPAEAKPWRDYRKLLLTEAHIQGGVEFWNRNRAALEEASARYGVASATLVAIVGVETRYGQVPGAYRVVDALSSLAFEYPRRADFFRKELEEFLLLCREEGIDALLPQGSYAGAMGMPQFMPSSYRQYAVDMDGDQRRNIWTNPTDAIASVANYLARAGWREGEPVAFPAKAAPRADIQNLLESGAKPARTLAQLRRLGVESETADAPGTAPAKLLALEGENGPEYWLTLQNFYVITRYNHSPLYAMAVFQLGKEIQARRALDSGSPRNAR